MKFSYEIDPLALLNVEAEVEVINNTPNAEAGPRITVKQYLDMEFKKLLIGLVKRHGAIPVKPAIPRRVASSQGRAALILTGRLEAVEALIANMPDQTPEEALVKELTRNAFERDLYWEYDNRYLQALAGPNGLNLTPQELDELFILADQQ